MAERPRSKADHQLQIFLILCLWLLVGYLGYLYAARPGGFSGLVDDPGGGDTSSEHKEIQAGARKDLANLGLGTVIAYYPKTVQVDQSFKIELAVCASPVANCLINKEPNIQMTKPHEVGVEANVAAKLQSPSRNLAVESDGNGERLVFKDTNAKVQRWEWSFTAARPGTYDITIEVTPQQAISTRSLGTVLVQDIIITAEDTAATWSARAAGRISAFFSSVGGALAAQFAAVVGFLVYRHSKRNSPAPAAQALPMVQQQPTSSTAPTAARRVPPKPRKPVATTPRNGARKRR
ncbi:hypothetical protein [Actinoplanes sp. NPDC049802]|uniref:hypothetical protein n=1 Tax=Actinoplanes sp. NPDC049802 TaxID=3154742 RepID=UPI0034081842